MIAALALAALVAAAPPAPRPGEPVVEPVRENALVGQFAALPDTTRHPTIIILGGFDGGIPGEAPVLASQGYAAFAVAYFRAGNLPNEVDEIPVETVSRAIDWLRARPEADPDRIGVLGISKGAELALLAASRDPRIKSVAVISPTAYVWFAPVFGTFAPRSSWTANGGPVPFIPWERLAESNLRLAYQGGGTFAFREIYDPSLLYAPPAVLAKAAIPVERINGPILCVAGTDDQQWDSAAACRTIAERRRAAHRDAGDSSALEPLAGHATSLGGRPEPGVVPAGRMRIRLGGDLAANARGMADAWNRTLTFFARTL